MLERHARYVPVMDGTTLLGVVSFHDVAKAVYDEQNFENRMLKSYIEDSPDEASALSAARRVRPAARTAPDASRSARGRAASSRAALRPLDRLRRQRQVGGDADLRRRLQRRRDRAAASPRCDRASR